MNVYVILIVGDLRKSDSSMEYYLEFQGIVQARVRILILIIYREFNSGLFGLIFNL